MMARGLLAEVQALLARYGPDGRALKSLGYRQLVRHLAGDCTLEDAVVHIKRDTRQFARRQLTWFRSEPGVLWYPSSPADLPAQAVRFFAQEDREAHGSSDG
jgi:tRNA dimethylallyltransferase